MCLFRQEKVKTISKKILFFSTQEKKTETFLPLPLVQSWLHVKSGTTREGIPSPLESHSSLKASSIKRTEKYKEILTTFESGEKRGEEKSYCMDFLITRNHNDEMKEEWEIENFLTRGDTARVASNSRCVFHHRQDDEETRSLFDSVWLLINVFWGSSSCISSCMQEVQQLQWLSFVVVIIIALLLILPRIEGDRKETSLIPTHDDASTKNAIQD